MASSINALLNYADKQKPSVTQQIHEAATSNICRQCPPVNDAQVVVGIRMSWIKMNRELVVDLIDLG